MTALTDAIVELCNGEAATFKNGALKEYNKAVFQRVGEYWNTLAETPKYKDWKGYNGRSDSVFDLDANGEVVGVPKVNKNQPWSAAFISWVMRRAGAGSRFAYSSSHSTYIVKALKEAKNAASVEPFIARRHNDYAPKIGDLIACERRKDTDATFDTYIRHVAAGKFEAHCDFVVAIDAGARTLTTIGGNVSQSVKRKTWPINEQGRIGDHDPESKVARVICVIENRL
jgi:hypothetical protein